MKLTMARHMTTVAPNSEKYATNVGRLNNSSRSSRERVGSGTIPKNAISTAPPAMKSVPRIIHGENTSPSKNRAKNAFQRRETAPSGARITTGSDAIWTNDPRILEKKNIANKSASGQLTPLDQVLNIPKPNSHNLQFDHNGSQGVHIPRNLGGLTVSDALLSVHSRAGDHLEHDSFVE
jgi:hypothetical protein